jgi:cell wall assembly regulator SMI1
MMVTIEGEGCRIDERRVADIETLVAAKLPSGYRDFLLRHNGGRPTPDVIDINGLPGGAADIKNFFGFDQEFESENLIWHFEIMRENVPWRHLLPIAGDSFGNTFCLDLAPDSYGRVVYFDLKGDDSEFYDVAPDFEAFLEKIYPWVEESPEP